MKASDAPNQKTLTLKALYQQVTGDLTTHQRTIHAHFLKLDPRRQAMIADRRQGTSYHVIAASHGIDAASARETILRGFEVIRKAAAGEPYFNKVGRKKVGGGN